MIAGFKSAATRRINDIRDHDESDRIRHYIVENPPRWAEDPENPATANEHREP